MKQRADLEAEAELKQHAEAASQARNSRKTATTTRIPRETAVIPTLLQDVGPYSSEDQQAAAVWGQLGRRLHGVGENCLVAPMGLAWSIMALNLKNKKTPSQPFVLDSWRGV